MNLENDISEADFIRIRREKIVAVDCEMGGFNPFRDRLYIIQLCEVNQSIHIIKNDNWQSVIWLKKLFTDDEIVKVFHFAIMDCAFILNYLNVAVKNPYCTKIASKIARTYSDIHNLKSLIEEFLGIKIDKTLRNSFWGSKTITQEQLDYAANDVRYLLEIKQNLERILVTKGNLRSGISFFELNKQCQEFIPTLTLLWINGWDFGKEDTLSVFGR